MNRNFDRLIERYLSEGEAYSDRDLVKMFRGLEVDATWKTRKRGEVLKITSSSKFRRHRVEFGVLRIYQPETGQFLFWDHLDDNGKAPDPVMTGSFKLDRISGFLFEFSPIGGGSMARVWASFLILDGERFKWNERERIWTASSE